MPGHSFGSSVSFCGRSIPIEESLQVRKIPKVEKTKEPTTRESFSLSNDRSEATKRGIKSNGSIAGKLALLGSRRRHDVRALPSS